MLNKNNNLFFILLTLTVYPFYIASENSSITLKEFSKELKRSTDTTKTISFEFAIHVLQEGYSICSAIEKIKPQISSQLGAKCKECSKILSCAEFAGCLLASGMQNKLDDFKKLLSDPEIQPINMFIKNTANEQKIKCAQCGKLTHWENRT
jgi:hypothetical protein